MIDGVNRLLLTLLALAAVAAGVLGLLAARNLLPLPDPAELYEQMATSAAARPRLWYAAIYAGCAAAVLLGLLLAWRQLLPAGPRRQPVATLQRSDRGVTRVEGGAVADALASDLQRLPGVARARVSVIQMTPRPRLTARLDAAPDADVNAMRSAAETAFARLRRSLDADEVDVDLRIRLSDRSAARVE